LLGEVNNACDAAHESFLYFERRPPLATGFSLSAGLISPEEDPFARFAFMILKDAKRLLRKPGCAAHGK
jgi:hypothetical protein